MAYLVSATHTPRKAERPSVTNMEAKRHDEQTKHAATWRCLPAQCSIALVCHVGIAVLQLLIFLYDQWQVFVIG